MAAKENQVRWIGDRQYEACGVCDKGAGLNRTITFASLASGQSGTATIVAATTYHDKPEILAEVSAGLGQPMRGVELSTIPREELLAGRGW